MVSITFIERDDTRKTVEAEPGYSIMEVAIRNGIEGIVAECGGQCSCATCHVYVEGDFLDKVGKPVDDEEGMLEFSDNRQPNSRLGCQIAIADDMDGMTVRVAPEDV